MPDAINLLSLEAEVSDFIAKGAKGSILGKLEKHPAYDFIEAGLMSSYYENPQLLRSVTHLRVGSDIAEFSTCSGNSSISLTLREETRQPPSLKFFWEVNSIFNGKDYNGLKLNGERTGPIFTPSLNDCLKLASSSVSRDARAYESRLLAIWHDPTNRSLYKHYGGKPQS